MTETRRNLRRPGPAPADSIEEEYRTSAEIAEQIREQHPRHKTMAASDPGANAERLRIQMILRSAAATTRPKFAHYLAFETNYPAEEAIVFLGLGGHEAPSVKRGWLDGRVPQPNVGALALGETNAAEGWNAAVERVNVETKKSAGLH
jgi:hypothetical protein